jgi:hypothetical protein
VNVCALFLASEENKEVSKLRVGSLVLWLGFGISALAQQVNTDILPATPGLNIGHINQAWNDYFNNLAINGTCVQNGPSCLAGVAPAQTTWLMITRTACN